MSQKYQYLFGPVLSRRFGRSLGVDVISERVCSFDCVFCEAGRTDISTMTRAEYAPMEDVVAELKDWFASDGQADVVTLSGSGEPTLHVRFGDVIDAVHAYSDLPAVLLTNGTLLGDFSVRRDASRADTVKFSLSVWDDHSLQKLNVPAAGVTFETMVEGMCKFREMYAGELRAEVMVVKGVNDHREALLRIADVLRRIRPDRIELNTVVRPPCDLSAKPIDSGSLLGFADLFEPRAEVPILAPSRLPAGLSPDAAALLSLLRRRPCPASELASLAGMPEAVIVSHLNDLVRQGQLHEVDQGGQVYYMVN